MRVKQTLYNGPETMNHPHPSLVSHTHSSQLQTVCVSKKMAQFVFFRSVNRTDTPAPLPFILISILSDKPPQSHSRSRLYPSTHDTSCRPSPKPQRGSNSTPLSASTPPPPLPLFAPHPALDDAGWRGPRHASTETPEERKGGNEGWREGSGKNMQEVGWMEGRFGKKKM